MFRQMLLTGFLVSLFSCGKAPLPKPSGELRLEYPAAAYQEFRSPCGFSFQYSDYARVVPGKQPCWYYIQYPTMKARVFVTYFPVRDDLQLHIAEAEKMVYGHTVKASAIETKSFAYPEKKVFGNFYELKGQTASNIQLYATDSARHFVTASLYFNTRPKPDSLAPAVEYIRKDLKLSLIHI